MAKFSMKRGGKEVGQARSEERRVGNARGSAKAGARNGTGHGQLQAHFPCDDGL